MTKRIETTNGSNRHRQGAITVWCAFLLAALLGMVGLVIDGGMLMVSHRQLHNAADAAAMMAAMSLLHGNTVATAQADGTTAVTNAAHNNFTNAAVTINIPPQSGPYAGNASYADALVSNPIPTFFIHVLPGVAQGNTVNARAVAGRERVNAGQGVMTLDPNSIPGLKINGGASLCVDGDVYVNSEGGGVDENGDPAILDGPGQTGTTVSNNGTLCAMNMNIVGGVNANGLNNIINSDGSPGSPLHANALPAADPLINLPTPTVSNGVVDIYHGSPQISSGGIDLDDGNRDAASLNHIVDAGLLTEKVVLYPGIYTSIHITGGTVELMPGIYVLRPNTNTNDTLIITGNGTTVTALGVMFYNTGDNYDQYSGAPDNGDYLLTGPPPPPDDPNFGGVTINTDATLMGIDTTNPAYDYTGMPGISIFDNMLFYQRRMNDERLQIEGDSANNFFDGTVYGKWMPVSIDGTATFQSSFVVGELSIEGQGNVQINPDINSSPKVFEVFVVE